MHTHLPGTAASREETILAWDEELLKGGVVLSEWSAFLVQDADMAFCAGADLAALFAACAAIESHLRFEYGDGVANGAGLAELVHCSHLPEGLAMRIDQLRRYRNQWVHVRRPHDDDALLAHPDRYRDELQRMAEMGIRTMREVLYANPWI